MHKIPNIKHMTHSDKHRANPTIFPSLSWIPVFHLGLAWNISQSFSCLYLGQVCGGSQEWWACKMSMLHKISHSDSHLRDVKIANLPTGIFFGGNQWTMRKIHHPVIIPCACRNCMQTTAWAQDTISNISAMMLKIYVLISCCSSEALLFVINRQA